MASAAPAGHVVVIDDAPDLLSFYRELFGDEGYRVTALPAVADDPAEVLRLGPDLIVLDLLYAQQEQGLPFLRRLRADPAGATVGVLVCSAATGALREHAAELLALDAEPVAKPFDLDDLLTRARRLCDRSAKVRNRASIAVETMRAAVGRGLVVSRRADPTIGNQA